MDENENRERLLEERLAKHVEERWPAIEAQLAKMVAALGHKAAPAEPESPYSGTAAFHGDPAPLFAALAKAQGAFPPIPRTRMVSILTKAGATYRYLYAPLEEVINACRAALAENGLCFVEKMVELKEGRILLAYLGHTSGSYMEGRLLLPKIADQKDFGSMVTYARRYQRQAMLGVAPEDDDDGAEADGDDREPVSAPPPRSAPPRPQHSPTGDRPHQRDTSQPTTDADIDKLFDGVREGGDGFQGGHQDTELDRAFARFVFDVGKATTREELKRLSGWMNAFDTSDPVVQAAAERGKPIYGARWKTLK